jgi:hypothetical protein
MTTPGTIASAMQSPPPTFVSPGVGGNINGGQQQQQGGTGNSRRWLARPPSAFSPTGTGGQQM